MKNHLVKKALLAAGMALSLGAAPAVAQYCGTSIQTPLMAGQHYESGSVIVGNDTTNLYVTYSTEEPWLMREIHFAVANSLAGLPTNRKGSPIPGHFPYKATFTPGTDFYTIVIPLAGFPVGSPIYLAAHAVVEQPGQNETGWGQGPRFPRASNWSMYFTYVVQDCGGGGE